MVAHRHVFLRVRDETFTLRIYIYQLTQCNTLISKLHHSKWFSFLIPQKYFNVWIIFYGCFNIIMISIFNYKNHMLNEDVIFTFRYIIWVITHHGLQNMYSHVFPHMYKIIFLICLFFTTYKNDPYKEKKFYAKTAVDGYKKQ